MKRPVPVALTLALLAGGCPPRRAVPIVPPAAPTADAEPPATDASAVPSDASAEVPVSAEMERLLAEAERMEDPAITFSRVTQTPPPHRYSVARLGRFPTREIARAVLYTFGWSAVPGACGPDDPRPFTRAGTLCAEVVSPGVALEASETARVTALLTASDAALAEAKKSSHWSLRPRARCDFEPHHAVAFYDARGAVIGQVLVCFTCGEWQVTPGSESLGGGDHALMTPDERATLAGLFDAHDLAAWRFGKKYDEVATYERAIYGTRQQPTKAGVERRARRLAAGSGAPPSSPLRALGVADRQKLCDWSAHRVEPTGEPWRERGYRCDDGRTWTTTPTLAGCATVKVSCERTVAEVEACLRVYREPDDLCGASPPAPCAGMLECLPGIVAPGSASRADAGSGSRCTSDGDCRLGRVFSCGEVLSCQSACQGAGKAVALGLHDPDPVEPKCGKQPPCTPMCPTPMPTPIPNGQAPGAPTGPHAACVRGRCVVASP